MRQVGWVVLAVVGVVGCMAELPAPAEVPAPPPQPPPVTTPLPDAGPRPIEPGAGACVPNIAGACGRASCGQYDDGCGGKAECGRCLESEVCSGADGRYPGVCTTPLELASCTEVAGREALDAYSGGIAGLRECVADGWCTENGHLGLRPSLWGFAEDDVWAVGGSRSAVALHWDGARWTRIPTPAAPGLRSVWGASSQDVWAVGLEGTVLRWDGRAWRAVASGTTSRLADVHGTGPDDVWLVGPEVALHWDGTRLSASPGWIPASALDPEEAGWSRASVWAVDRETVFAGHSGGCLRWMGTRWETTPCKVPGVTDIWASGPEDVWVVGTRQNTMSETTYRAHWDGREWKTELANDWENPRYERWSSVWGLGPKEVWVSGTWRYDGTKWHRLCSGTAQDSLWGMPGGRLVGGSQAGLSRFDGQGWRYTATLRMQAPAFVHSAAGAKRVLDNHGVLLEHDGERWRSRYLAGGPGFGYGYGRGALAGVAADDFWVAGWGVWHWDGQAWTSSLPGRDVRAVWATSRSDAWAAGVEQGRSRLWRWDGTTWQAQQDVDLGSDFIASMWGSGPGDIWALGYVGDAGGWHTGTSVTWHWDGQRWSRLGTTPGLWLFGAFGVGGRLWALSPQPGPGAALTLYEWRDGAFAAQRVLTNTRGGETQLAGTAPHDVWASVGLTPTGGSTRLLHFDGAAWHERAPLPGWVLSLGSVPGVATYALDYDGVLWERRAP
ncbi:MAG TPA: hypothetical protein VFO83_08295 [Aggregicoccus sp.]|nr:hypothetical protein [Aggregicoccus sp.]